MFTVFGSGVRGLGFGAEGLTFSDPAVSGLLWLRGGVSNGFKEYCIMRGFCRGTTKTMSKNRLYFGARV